MASGKHILCGPCMFDDIMTDARRWCTHCGEGLCKDCEKVHRKSDLTKNHEIMPISDSHEIEHVSISNICQHHGKNLEWFCKTHDNCLCVDCKTSNHKSCSDIISISVASTLLNVKQCIKNRESATKEIKERELEVKNMILETRTKINLHLNMLEEKLLCELKSTTNTCKSMCMKFLKKLESTEEMLTKLREQTLHMKEFSSEIQVFLGTRQVTNLIAKETNSIKNELGDAKDYRFQVTLHELIEKFVNIVHNYGKITVSEFVVNFDFKDQKSDQAQIMINLPTERNISNINIQLIKTFQMRRSYDMQIRGCVILPNGRLLMSNFTGHNYLVEYSQAGKHIRDIRVSEMPFDIAVIDLRSIVVTYGNAAFLEIMNVKTFAVSKKISLPKSCFGVSYVDERLYVANAYDIEVIDISGRHLETLKTASNTVVDIATCKHKIFYTDFKKDKVHCCRLDGVESWQFKNELITSPRGVAVDNNNNVFVVGYKSTNLTIIQNDGQKSRTLLTESDGLLNPRAVYYDTDKNTLLICNIKGKVALYNVD